MPKTIAHRSALISSASSIIFVLSAYASPLPADVSGATVVENNPSELNEIVVTSQRRSENLQTIPLSVTAATASELLNEGVTGTASLSLAVPGLSYTLGGNGATPFIRGVGTTINSVGNEASVATYVDGVYISSINAQLFELANIDRIEVMKGPQGTLFGRNATGGVIQIITKDPSFTPSADVHVRFSGVLPTARGSSLQRTTIARATRMDWGVTWYRPGLDLTE